MSGLIPDSVLDAVLERVDIVEVVSDFLPLQKAGKSYKALCPFHKEKTASFNVSPDKQIFHCFGCRAGGNAFRFLMLHEGLNFYEAVKTLAERAGVRLPRSGRGEPDGSLRLIEANECAAAYFHGLLEERKEGKRGLSYVSERGISRETIDTFRIGYSPADSRGLVAAAGKMKMSARDLENAGLLSKSSSGGVRGRFRQRVMFPISSVAGRVVGFGGRVLGKDVPKYLNSPETPVYRKGHILYGLHLAREEMRRRQQAVLVEGYTDLVRLWQEGIRNVVASLGTSLTEDHVRLVKRYAKEAVIVFDGDDAGADASLRGLDLLVAGGVRVRIASLPAGEDPDDFVAQRGGPAMERVLEQAQDIIDYKLQRLESRHDRSTAAGRVDIIDEMLDTLAGIPHAVEKSEALRAVAQRIGVDEQAVRVQLGRHERKGARRPEESTPAAHQPEPMLERTLLRLLLENPELGAGISGDVTPDDFSHPDYRRIANVLFVEGGRGLPVIMSRLEGEGVSDVLARIMMDDVACSDPDRVVQDCVVRMKEQRAKTERSKLRIRIEEAEKARDTAQVRELLGEYQKWSCGAAIPGPRLSDMENKTDE